ncbi:hypothetical protein SVIOM342S_03604 [Streptomyces violaceorubidus]
MNKPLRRIAIFCGLLVLTLLIRDNWLQYVQADELKEDEHNRRVAIERYASPRGDIIVDGKAITGHATTEGDFKYKRTYKDGAMWAPVTGYVSQAFGATQLESDRRRHPHRQRRPALLPQHPRHDHGREARGRQRRHHPQQRRPEGRRTTV